MADFLRSKYHLVLFHWRNSTQITLDEPGIVFFSVPYDDGWSAQVDGVDAELYGRTLNLWLYCMLRPERKFDSMESLRAQILTDREQTIAYFSAKTE